MSDEALSIETLLTPFLQSDRFIALLDPNGRTELRLYSLDGKGGTPVGNDEVVTRLKTLLPSGWKRGYGLNGRRILPLMMRTGDRIQRAEEFAWKTPYGAVQLTRWKP
jgi:hypothetical protein